MNRKSSIRRILQPAALSLAVSLAMIFMHAMGLFDSFERQSFDLRLRWNPPQHPPRQDVVLLMITQRSLDSLKEGDEKMGWPWRREVYGNVVDYCMQGGARALFFDLFFSEPSLRDEGLKEKLDDPAFADAMSRSGRAFVALALEERKETGSVPRLPDRYVLPVEGEAQPAWHEYPSVTPPTELLAGSVKKAVDVRVFPDPDGVVRSYPLAGRYRQYLFSSLALAAAMEATGTERIDVSEHRSVRMGYIRIPVDDQGQMILRYAGANPPFKRYDIVDVLMSMAQEKPKIPPTEFKDKIILIGASAPGLLDLRVTPFSDVTPGVEIHATAIHQILNQEFIIRPVRHRAVTNAVILVLSIVTTLVVRRSRALWGAVFVLATLGILVLMSNLLFRSGFWVDTVAPLVTVVFSFIGIAVYNYATEGRRRRELKKAFERYLAPAVVDKVVDQADQLTLSGERKVLTVLFLDFAGFTTMSETRDPIRVVHDLNRYHNVATEEIFRQEGVVDKFMGDAVMAFWGDPVVQPDHARRACVAAVRIQERLRELAARMHTEGGAEMHARIGINTGPMVVGNMGSEQFFDYTVIGDEVNLGSRLEGVNKEFGTSIIAGENTVREARGGVEARELALIRVKGKTVPVRIYEVLGMKGEVGPDVRARAGKFSEALEAYRRRDWSAAERIFTEILSGAPDEGPARIYQMLCRQYRSSAPGPDWDGAYEMHTK